MNAPVGVTQEEGHTGFLNLRSAVLALIFLARRIQSSLSLVDHEIVFFGVPRINRSPLFFFFFFSIATMSFAGYFLVRSLLSAFPAFISDFRFDLVWFRLSCDHGWIRSGSVNNVR